MRLFVAAPLPVPQAEQVWRALGALRDRHPGARWLPPDKLHLTLVFLGATPSSQAEVIGERISTVVAGKAPFAVRTGRPGGVLRDGRGGVAWLGLGHGAGQVSDLALELDRAIGSGTYDARRSPRPHLTVARGVDQAALDDLQSAPALDIGWRMERVVLFRSHTDPGGSRYEELVSSPLTAAAGHA